MDRILLRPSECCILEGSDKISAFVYINKRIKMITKMIVLTPLAIIVWHIEVTLNLEFHVFGSIYLVRYCEVKIKIEINL